MHVSPLPDGGAQLRLTRAELERLTGNSFPALLALRDQARSQVFLAECSQVCAAAAEAGR